MSTFIFRLQELSEMAPDREWRLIEINACLADIDTHRQHLLGQPSSNSPPFPLAAQA